MWDDETPDWFFYRGVYGPAWRRLEMLRYHESGHRIDPIDPKLRARVLQAVREEMGDALDSFPPEIVAEAVDDAMHGRQPRC